MEEKMDGLFKMEVEGIDPSTGEVIRFESFYTEALLVVPYRKRITHKRWFVMFQDFLEQLAKDKELTGTHLRVLFFLFSKVDFENWVQIPQRVIANELKIPRQKVGEAIKLLKEKAIIQVVKDGRSNRYRIHPELIWKGRYKDRTKVQENVISLKRKLS